MKFPLAKRLSRLSLVAAVLVVAASALVARPQQMLPTYPGYADYQKAIRARDAQPLFKSGELKVTWTDGGKGFDFNWDGKAHHFDIATSKDIITGDAPPEPATATAPARGRGGPADDDFDATDPRDAPQRGRGPVQIPGGGGGIDGLIGEGRSLASVAGSPDGRLIAAHRDCNLFLSSANGANEIAVTTDGNAKNHVRSGKATTVYGEDLEQGTGMWWSPDSKKLAFYRFDEKDVADYSILTKQVPQYDTLVEDPYPKAGTVSPVVDVLIYDVASRKTVKLDIRDGKPFADDTLGYYAYRFYWTHDSNELVFSRMNRKQDTVEICAADPQTGKCRVIVHEEHLANNVDWKPAWEFLPDMNRFILTSERNGFKNFYLYEMSGKLLATLTDHQFEVANIVKIDEAGKQLYYMARDGENQMKLQLHRVNMDGTGDTRLTDPAFNHTITVSPDNQHFIDVYQTHDLPPVTRLLDATGKIVAELAKGNIDRMTQLNLKPPELFTFKTFDGSATLQGMLNYPSNFDPNKKYPLLLSVYGGPNTVSAKETFAPPNAQAEYGFLVAAVDARSMNTRGRAFSDPFYHHLGIIEMDDQAAGVAELDKRPYVNSQRVGVYGTSYGGTSAATLIMRYPDLFQAASSSSPVTDYRNYNCVYAERHNGLFSENKAGYDAATVMTYVPNLRGRLLLYYGTADNNVHNSNMMQLITALQKANKSFEVQVGPDMGHTGVNPQRMTEFFIENLVMK